MEKLKKLKLRDIKMMTDQEMKFITGGVGSGTGSGGGSGYGSGDGHKGLWMRSCTIYYCSGGTGTFGCDVHLPIDVCLVYMSQQPDFCGGGCFDKP